MADICLINLREHGTRDLIDRSQHLGLNSIAAYLSSNGIDTCVIDANFQWYDDDQVLELVLACNPVAVGFTLYEFTLERVIKIAKAIKQVIQHVHIMLGGHNASFAADDILVTFTEIDSVVIGEGEQTCFELVKALKEGKHWKNIDGIAYADGSLCIHTSPRALIQDLNQLPRAWRSGPIEGIQTEYLNISASRGCYSRCSFCTTPDFYGLKSGKLRFRARSVDNLLDEIEYLIELYGKDIKLWFSDDNFTHIQYFSRGWFNMFTSGIARRGLTFKFGINARTDSVTTDLFSQLKDAGLDVVFIGVESGVQETLDLYKKKLSVETNKNAIEILDSLGLNIRIGWIMYNPYSTLEQLELNLEFLKDIGYFTRLRQYRYPISLKGSLSLYPGTPMLNTLLPDRDIRLYRTEYLDYRYEFREQRIAWLIDLLSDWTNPVKEFILHDTLCLLETASNYGMYSLRDEIEYVSDRFMNLDLEYYSAVLKMIAQVKSWEQAKLQHESIYQLYAPQLDMLNVKLSSYRDMLLGSISRKNPAME